MQIAPPTLRPYQIESQKQISKFWDYNRRAIIFRLDTGGGKTVVFSDMARKAINNGLSAMVLCNRTELIDQAKNKLNNVGLYPTVIGPKYRGQTSDLYVASIQTLRNRKLPEIDLLIVDEAHIRDFDPIVMEYKRRGVYIIGATATPMRYGKKLLPEDHDLCVHYPTYTGALGDVYDEMVDVTNILQLIADDHLVPAVTFSPDVDLKELKKQGEDFSTASMYAAYNKIKMYSGVVDNYLKFAKGKRAICFNINVEHSIKTCEEFIARGIPAAHVDGTTKNRHLIFEAFHRGEILVLCNCEVATTGFDEPRIECVIINRPTASENLYLQMCGRGGRPCLELNKSLFVIIDHGLNFYRFGYWQQEREYSLAKDFVRNKKGVAPAKRCESCEAIIFAVLRECPYCKMQQSVREHELKVGDAEFVEMSDEHIPAHLKTALKAQSVDQLEETREYKKYTIGWLVRQLMTRQENDLYYYADLKKYSHAWTRRQITFIKDEREKVTDKIWEFMQNNPHLSDEAVKEYSERKLLQVMPSELAESVMSKILDTQKELRAE